ncbi:MAG: hypothetical protein AAB458_01335 [Patescibacteria group bacterium]
MKPIRVCVGGRRPEEVLHLARALKEYFNFFLSNLTESEPDEANAEIEKFKNESCVLFALRHGMRPPANCFTIMLRGHDDYIPRHEEGVLVVYTGSLVRQERVFHVRDTLLRQFPQLRLGA